MQSMWIRFASLTLALGTMCGIGWADERPGLIIYMSPPISKLGVAESIWVTSNTRKNIVYSDVRLKTGETREILNGGIIAYFDNPPTNPTRESFANLATLELRADKVSREYPGVKSSVATLIGSWKAAQQEFARRPIAGPAVAKSMQLTVGAATYLAVTLESVDGAVARIFHSDGIANIQLASLTPLQIAALNSTSTTAHIDPNWPEKQKQAELEKAKLAAERAKQAAEAAAAQRELLITKARQMEEAARYEDALTSFVQAGSENDVKRVAGLMAQDYEKRKDYDSAAEYFEKAGLFSEAGRIRKSYNITDSVPSRLSSEEIFRRCAPATVSIVTGSRRGVGVGSGFFVKKGGYILTNRHVIENARELAVVVDKETFDAEVIAQTKIPDLAILKIPLENHPILEFADSDRVRAGAQAYAIGTPNGLPKSITGGMISATDRKKFGNDVFQMSVLINHGNSGGPVLNESGRVIGISTFGEGTAVVVEGVSLGSDIQGINYAIKANEAKSMLGRITK